MVDERKARRQRQRRQIRRRRMLAAGALVVALMTIVVFVVSSTEEVRNATPQSDEATIAAVKATGYAGATTEIPGYADGES